MEIKTESLIALVAVNDAARAYDKAYTYLLPEELGGAPGCRVMVPFGRRNTLREGLILKLGRGSPSRLKTVEQVLDESPVLTEELLELMIWLKSFTFCTYFDAFKTVASGGVPAHSKRKTKAMTEIEALSLESPPEASECFSQGLRELVLSSEQQEVYDGLRALMDRGEAGGALLRGVTGSGKTAVFIKLIEYTLLKGKGAIMLLPEIALTPQMTKQFKELFGSLVEVVHSGLTATQRRVAYHRVQHGYCRVVIGTRSGVFAPVNDLGLIIMDEEGERSYKSDSSPRYHARDVAKMRCGRHGCLLLMASATPSIESYYYASSGRYRLFTLDKRYSQTALPEVSIVDMAESGDGSSFSYRLREELLWNLEQGQQSILLLNRRGYRTYISCPKCRATVECPNCSVSLTYHQVGQKLMCHYCGYTSGLMTACPACGYDKLKQCGVGTQRIEDELSELFPEARVLRMDLDTTGSRFAYEKGFADFAKGKYDILLGTQMIAKGLDFPNVTLVGVISVDNVLFSGDFRSYERTFALITQVVGRSGRAEKPGRALLQTHVPEHYVLSLGGDQDYDRFYREEIALRKALTYPPFCDICVVSFHHEEASVAEQTALHFLDLLKSKTEVMDEAIPMKVLGPAKSGLSRLKGKYRYQLVIKCHNNHRFRCLLESVLESAYTYSDKGMSHNKAAIIVDINGDLGG